MGFIGSINTELRKVVAEVARGWSDAQVYVGCSGNFTVERILKEVGVAEIHGNDISLYSSVLGNYLAGHKTRLGIKRDDFEWMLPFLGSEVEKIACLLVSSKLLEFADRDEPYHRRMFTAYRKRFPELHADTVEKVDKALDGMQIDSFWAGDCIEFIRNAPSDAVVVSFPPTYKGGYERLYAKMDEIFDWDPPEYELFDENSFSFLVDEMMKKREWLTLRDEPVEMLKDYLVALVQTGARSKPVYVYGSHGRARLVLPRQKITPLPYSRIYDETEGELHIVKIETAQINWLRSQYLSNKIVPAAPNISLAVLLGDKLVGALGFSPAKYGHCSDDTAYMMADFCIAPTLHRRLSKLVLAAALSSEVRGILEENFNRRISTIFTTAFTDKPVSMKYRGLFEVANRKEGAINYEATAGRWSLEEGLDWWKLKHLSKK
ncbi:MAG: hypothetical protein WC911_03615 [Thermoleophilia bacterium]